MIPFLMIVKTEDLEPRTLDENYNPDWHNCAWCGSTRAVIGYRGTIYCGACSRDTTMTGEQIVNEKHDEKSTHYGRE